MIITVDKMNLLQAAMIHSISWKESHRSFCVPDFVEIHTPERQQEYVQNKMNCGSKFYMLVEDMPVGVVSVKECLIEDLYILPDKQKMGYGTKLLRFAIVMYWYPHSMDTRKQHQCKTVLSQNGI